MIGLFQMIITIICIILLVSGVIDDKTFIFLMVLAVNCTMIEFIQWAKKPSPSDTDASEDGE